MFIAFLIERLHRWAERRAEMRALFAMSERELKDLGLARSEIVHAGRVAADLDRTPRGRAL